MSDAPGLAGHVKRLLAYPLPRGVGAAHVLGSLLLASFAIQVVTGALLALYYSSSAADAWESVRYIEDEVRAGSLIRGVHHFGSSSFVVLLVLHVVRTFVWGAYKSPRRWTWVIGCLLFGCVLAFGFTGYLLPWDVKAFFGTRVGVGIASSVPLIGAQLGKLLAGGASVGELTLPRFYALHAVILPLATAALIALHLTLMRVHGVTPHWKHGHVASGRAFFPHQTAKDLAAALALVLLLLALAHWIGAPLERKADPQDTDYVPRPEWYFLGAQQLLRIFQGGAEVLGSFVLPAIAAALLLTLPWLDRRPERDPRKRPLAMGAGGAALFAAVALTFWGNSELSAEERAMAERVAARETAERERAEKEKEPDEAAGGAASAQDENALVARGAVLYRELACKACHDEPAIAPSLDFEGEVVRREWLRPYLAEPVPIRAGQGESSARMPDFLLAEEELDALAAYLASRVDPDPSRFPHADFEREPSAAEADAGRELVLDLDCRSCHVLDGEGEPVGPRLDGVARRLRPGYVYALVKDPEGVIPGTSMTNFGLDDEEARAITRFLQTLR